MSGLFAVGNQVGGIRWQFDADSGPFGRKFAMMSDGEAGDRLVVTAREVVSDGAFDLVEVHATVDGPRSVLAG